ncbi:MAG TPA: S8 family serine peptidase [Acetobacteraceae bacterium]|nr:S8 family serine peptidase [Acetobacteraceae bacterium]
MARFIVANRLSGLGRARGSPAPASGSFRAAMAAQHDAFEPVLNQLRSDFDVRSDSGREAPRRNVQIEGDPQTMQKLAAELPRDVLVEPALKRVPASSQGILLQRALAAQGPDPLPAGFGATLRIRARGDGKPIAGAKALLMLADLRGHDAGTRMAAETDGSGQAEFPYNPAIWLPALLTVEPRNGYWDWWQELPQGDLSLELPALPKAGPIGWWHQAVGMTRYVRGRGEGIRIGVVDTGVGPHPYLRDVVNAGAVTEGAYVDGSPAGDDALSHGTHVCGIIAARPVEGSGDYCGVADAAKVISIRVFSAESQTSQGDVVEAIDRLAFDHQADIINLSLGGNQPSQIEQDAVRAAAEAGTICVAAAGNQFGQPLMFPAGYQETVAVSALGVLGAYPPGTMAARCGPDRPDRLDPNGLYFALFSNLGQGMSCAAPGAGIISTVPARPEVAAPYMAHNGTSMAAPIVSGALATLLAQDTAYRFMPRDANRTRRASMVLAATLRPLGISPDCVGGGMAQAWPA